VLARCLQSLWRGCERVLTEIKLKKGEPVDKALRRLKKKVDREGTLKVVRNQRHFEKPSERRRRKEKAARFSAMLSARYADS
jgi:small subunit ribosomal protein S21